MSVTCISCFFIRIRPSEHTLVCCGVREDLSGLYPKDKEFAWWAFSSCTASMSVLEAPNYLGKTGTETMFSIQTSSGKDIRAHSCFDNEDEILLPPGIYLKVIDSVSQPGGLRIIHLREIPPPFKMLDDPFDLSQLKTTPPESKPLLNIFKAPTEQEKYASTNVTTKSPVQASSKQRKLDSMIFAVVTFTLDFQQSPKVVFL
ncbi:unnamed protein product [Didymodactylos carnosus]|uniref:NAD(P)(+)--arginine ADP-ribosyltransferase n=1 Tax=Didymodactylos carnosus TaxID=1234261 RepID=A0A8S2H9T6_9BILA|nr:unnamed protein product [Didymodactylos carnosus]CAF3610732.1 unnamed protein product [Didymodactylos carnosus]